MSSGEPEPCPLGPLLCPPPFGVPPAVLLEDMDGCMRHGGVESLLSWVSLSSRRTDILLPLVLGWGSLFNVSDQSVFWEHETPVFRRYSGILLTTTEAPDASPPLLQVRCGW